MRSGICKARLNIVSKSLTTHTKQEPDHHDDGPCKWQRPPEISQRYPPCQGNHPNVNKQDRTHHGKKRWQEGGTGNVQIRKSMAGEGGVESGKQGGAVGDKTDT